MKAKVNTTPVTTVYDMVKEDSLIVWDDHSNRFRAGYVSLVTEPGVQVTVAPTLEEAAFARQDAARQYMLPSVNLRQALRSVDGHLDYTKILLTNGHVTPVVEELIDSLGQAQVKGEDEQAAAFSVLRLMAREVTKHREQLSEVYSRQIESAVDELAKLGEYHALASIARMMLRRATMPLTEYPKWDRVSSSQHSEFILAKYSLLKYKLAMMDRTTLEALLNDDGKALVGYILVPSDD